MKIEFIRFKEAADVLEIVPGHGRLINSARDSITSSVLQDNIKDVLNHNNFYIIFRKKNKDYTNFNFQVSGKRLKILKIKAFKRFNYFNANKNREIAEVSS